MNNTFISYSRRDRDFVQKLVNAFKSKGRDVWIDWEDIPPTAEWLNEIRLGIENADNFVFVLSPDSAKSNVCIEELEHALRMSKRLVPILHREVDPKEIHSALSSHNWIYFDKKEDFDTSFEKLLKALDMDLDYTRMHTRLLTRALEWQNRGRNDSLLLRGSDLNDYEHWLSGSSDKNPRPTAVQTEYIFASRRASLSRQRLVIRLLALGLIAALLLTLFAIISRREAEEARNIAQQQADENRSLLLADRASVLWANFDYDLASILALEANSLTAQPPASAQLILNQLVFSPGIRETVQASNSALNDLAISADGSTLLVAAFDGSISLWDVNTHQEIRRFEDTQRMPVTTVEFSPVQGSETIFAGLLDGTMTFWNTTTGEITARIGGIRTSEDTQGHRRVINSIDSAPLQKYFVSGSSDQTLIVWDASTETEIARFDGYANNILTVAMSQDGHYVAIGGENNIMIWDVLTRQKVVSLPGTETDVLSVAFSPDGTMLASSYRDNTVIVWNIITGREMRRLNQRSVDMPSGVIRGVSFTPDSQHLMTVSDDGSVIIWNYMDITQLHYLKKEGLEIVSFVMTPDGRQVITGTTDGRLTFWNISNEAVIHHYQGHTDGVNSAALSPDGTMMVTASDDHNLILWDTAGDDSIALLKGHQDRVKEAIFSPDGQLIASNGEDGTVILWDVQTRAEVRRLSLQSRTVGAVTFTPDGKELIGGVDDGSLVIWNVATGSIRTQFSAGDSRRILTVDVSPDGKFVAAGSADSRVILWDLATETVLHQFSTHVGRVLSVTYSADGRYLASAGLDGNILVWDTSTGELVTRLEGHRVAIWDVAFSPDGQIVAAGNADGIVSLWDLSLGEQVRTFKEHQAAVLSIAFSSDGQQMITASRDKTAILWNVPPITGMIATLKERTVDVLISCAEKETFRLYGYSCLDENNTPIQSGQS